MTTSHTAAAMASLASALPAGVTAPRFVLVSDLDHTMVQNEDPTHERLQLFNRLWSIHFAADSLLVFSTGRSPTLFGKLWDEAPLLTPNVLICSVGTEIFYRGPDGCLHPDAAWVAHLDQGWDRDAVQALAAQLPQLKPQVASEQRRHKLSYHLARGPSPADDEALLAGLRARLADAGLAAKVIYSGGVDVDILAAGAGKGKALEFLLRELTAAGLAPRHGVQVNGDSGNDAELFEVPGVRGCVVSNAHPELRAFADAAIAAGRGGGIHIASQPCAGGIVEALLHFGSLPAQQHQDGKTAAAAAASPQQLLRSMLVELATLQSNALAGNLALLSEPGATWITPGGRLLQVDGCSAEPADAAASGITWVDAISLRPLLQQQEDAAPPCSSVSPGELLLATYQLWCFKGQARDSARVRQCSAVLVARQPAAADGYKLLHLHESVVEPQATATAAFAALAAAQG